MIEFAVDHEGLILRYSSEVRGGDWISEKLKSSEEVTIGRIFTA
jgi:predicted Mrr-cat superfamily restriction endonuclease